MKKEIWKDVAGYAGRYQVSDQGRVRGPKGAMAPFTSRSGYLVATFNDHKKKLMHALVLETFIGPRPDGQESRHLNGVRGDNRLVNLRYGTKQENAADRKLHGTHRMGESHGCAKLNEQSVLAIRNAAGTLKEIAALHHVHFSTVGLIRQRKIWRHV